MRLMMQSLLAERFKLAVHTEDRTRPVFALVLANPGRLGSQLHPHPKGEPCPLCGLVIGGPKDGKFNWSVQGVSMEVIAGYLASQGNLDKPIVDKTGLSGDFDYSITVDQGAGRAPQSDVSGLSFEEALTDQLGLKLESITAPVPTVVIDHIEQPSPN